MKRKFQIFILLAALTNTLSAQEVKYVNSKGTETDLKKASFIETTYTRPNGIKIVARQKLNKDSISYTTFSSDNLNKREGKTILYYSSGKQHYVKYYRDNRLSGKLTCYYEDGKIKSIVQLDGDSVISMKSFDKNGLEVNYISDTLLPRFQNKSIDYRHFFLQNFNYPQSAAENNISAICKVSFSITEVGKVTDIDVQPEIAIFNKEITRVLKKTEGKWVPGEIYGEPCKIKLWMYVNFNK